MKNIRIFKSENFHFLVLKFSIYLNSRVFVMRDVRKRIFGYLFGYVCLKKIQISLRNRAIRSESSLGAFCEANDAKFLHADNKDSDQTARMCRLI